jgi:AcrR family transcriptional regulator
LNSATLATRQSILQAAMVCFSRKGYSHTSVDDIRTLSGISKGGIYHHFKSKEDIFVSMLERWMEDWRKVIDPELAQIDDFATWLHRYGQLYCDSLEFPLFHTFPEFYWVNMDSPYRQRLVECFAFEPQMLAEKIKEAQQSGLAGSYDSRILGEVLLSSLDGIVDDWLWNKEPLETVRQKFALTINIFLWGTQHL